MAIVYWPPRDAAGALPGSQTIALADATTNTAPDEFVIQHTTSGTAAAGFGETSAVELESAGGTTRRVMTDVTSLVTATDAAEVASRAFKIMNAGALADVVSFGFSSGFPTLFFGPSTDSTMIRRPSANTIDVWMAGTSFYTLSNGSKAVIISARLTHSRGASLASATTLTLGNDGNVFPITGTTTVNGIVTTGWAAGSRLVLELASGITITHNSGAPGASAVAIQLRAGVNLVTVAVYFLDLIYNGTFWYQPG